MNREARWLPPKAIVNLMGSTGIMLVLFAIPFGIEATWLEYHEPYVNHRTAFVVGVVATVFLFILGFTSYNLCIFFTRKHLEVMLSIVRSNVQTLVDELSHGKYENVVKRCAASRLTSKELHAVIEEYGEKIVPPPDGVYQDLKPMRIGGIPMPTWAVQVPLWSEYGRQSDLTLELMIAVVDGKANVEIGDLHGL